MRHLRDKLEQRTIPNQVRLRSGASRKAVIQREQGNRNSVKLDHDIKRPGKLKLHYLYATMQ